MTLPSDTVPRPWVRVAVAFACAAILVVRLKERLVLPQFWAEDGSIFYIASYTDALHGWRILFRPYAGYLHLIPRVVSAIGTAVPVLWVPAFFSWFTIGATAAIGWALQSPRLPLKGGCVVALALAAVPHTGEVYGALCNLQWVCAVAMIGLLIADDGTSALQRGADTLVLAVLGLTGPFIVITLPFFLLRAWMRKTRVSIGLAGTACLAALLQAPSLLLDRPPSDLQGPFNAWHALTVIGRRMVVNPLFGPYRPPSVVSALALVTGAVVLAMVVIRRRRIAPAACVVASIAFLLIVASEFKVRFDLFSYDELINGDRYFYPVKILVIWIATDLAFAWRARGVAVLMLLIACALAFNRQQFVFPAFPDLKWRQNAEAIEEGKPTMVEILPGGLFLYHPGVKHTAP